MKKWNAAVSLLLVFCLLCGLAPLPTRAEEEAQPPELTVKAEFYDPKPEGTVFLRLEIGFLPGSGNLTVNAAEDVTVRLRGTEGMRVEPDTFTFPFIFGTEQVNAQCVYTDPENRVWGVKPDDPQVIAEITSANCGKAVYTAQVNVMPAARVVSIRQAAEDGVLGLTQDQRDAASIFNQGFAGLYDGVPVEQNEQLTTSKASGSTLDAQLAAVGKESDENDILFLDLITHGLYDSDNNFQATNRLSFWDGDKGSPTYETILRSIQEHVKGRVVVVFDNCYSGHAVQAAAELGMDLKKYAVVSATEAAMAEPTAVSAFDYWETTAMGALQNKLQRRGRGKTECHTVGDLRELSVSWGQMLGGALKTGWGTLSSILMVAIWLLEDPIENTMNLQGLDVSLSTLWERLKEAGSNLVEDIKGLFSQSIVSEADQKSIWEILSDLKTGIKDKLVQVFNLLNKYSPLHFLVSAIDMADIGVVDENGKSGFNTLLNDSVHTYLGIMHPQFYGNLELPLFVYSEQFDDHYRLPALVEENLVVTPPGAIAAAVVGTSYDDDMWQAHVYLLDAQDHMLLTDGGNPAIIHPFQWFAGGVYEEVGWQGTLWVSRVDARTVLVETEGLGNEHTSAVYRLNAHGEPEAVENAEIGETVLLLERFMVYDKLPPASDLRNQYYVPADTPQEESRPIDRLLADIAGCYADPELMATSLENGEDGAMIAYTETYGSGGLTMQVRALAGGEITAVTLNDSKNFSVSSFIKKGEASGIFSMSDQMRDVYRAVIGSEALKTGGDRAALQAFDFDADAVHEVYMGETRVGYERVGGITSGNLTVHYRKYAHMIGAESFSSMLTITLE